MNENKKNLKPLRNFLIANWWMLWSVLLGTTLINIYIGYYIHSTMHGMEQEIRESSKKVVALSVNGEMVYAEKQTIDVSSKDFQNAVKNILLANLVVSAKKVTKNFTVMPKTEQDIMNADEQLKYFYKNYLANEGKQDFIFFLRSIGKLLSQHNLVETVTPIKTIVTNYTGNTKGFTISLLIKTAVTYYIEERDLTTNGVSSVTIKAKGYFNPAKGTVEDPLGIQFTALKVSLVKKPREEAK